MTRILVSNDDGIEAAGIIALAEALRELGEVWVVAPDREQSATSHSISLHEPLRIRSVRERWYAVNGTPTDAVYLALHHLLPGPPDVVVSGINHGPNLGNDVLYSGTVSAAMEGALFGHRAIAVSLCMTEKRDEATSDPKQFHFETAAEVAREVARAVLPTSMPMGVVLNLNVPNRKRADLAGLKLCRLGYTDWADAVTVRRDPRGRSYYWIGGDRRGHDDIADSDNNGVGQGYVTVTPIHYDLTDYRSFGYTRGLPIEGFARAPDQLGNEPLPHPVHPRGRKRN